MDYFSYLSGLYVSLHFESYSALKPKASFENLRSELIEKVKSMHEIPIYHGDIENNNLILTKKGVLVEIDFGFSSTIFKVVMNEDVNNVLNDEISIYFLNERDKASFKRERFAQCGKINISKSYW